MPVYTPNIPQPNDNPSNSQDQILQNFQTLNDLYGEVSGDHYPWTNTAPGIIGRHAKVTLPGLPTSGSPPGTALPTPIAGQGSIFAQTINLQTTPFYVRDNLGPVAPLTNIWPLLPIKAFASVTGTGADGVQTLSSSFNITSCNRTSAGNSRTFTFTVTNALNTNFYGIFPVISTGIDLTFARDGAMPTTVFRVVGGVGAEGAGTVLNVFIIEP